MKNETVLNENLLDSDTHEGQFLPYPVALALACLTGLAFVVSLCRPRGPRAARRGCAAKELLRRVALPSGLLFLFAGLTLLAVFGKKNPSVREYDYRGPMRIVGHRIEYESETTCSTRCESQRTRRLRSRRMSGCRGHQRRGYSGNRNRSGDRTYGSGSARDCEKDCEKVTKCHTDVWYDAHLTLEWGYDWASPKLESKLCTSEAVYDPCRGADTRQEAQKCLSERAGYDAGGGYTLYDPRDSPSLDADWPSVVFYGSTDSCSAKYDVPIVRLRRVKIAGVVLSALGAFLLVLCILWPRCGALKTLWGKCARVLRERASIKRANKEEMEPQEDESVASTVQLDSDSSHACTGERQQPKENQTQQA